MDREVRNKARSRNTANNQGAPDHNQVVVHIHLAAHIQAVVRNLVAPDHTLAEVVHSSEVARNPEAERNPEVARNPLAQSNQVAACSPEAAWPSMLEVVEGAAVKPLAAQLSGLLAVAEVAFGQTRLNSAGAWTSGSCTRERRVYESALLPETARRGRA